MHFQSLFSRSKKKTKKQKTQNLKNYWFHNDLLKNMYKYIHIHTQGTSEMFQ